MPFRSQKCGIPTVYCGDNTTLPTNDSPVTYHNSNYYSRKGTQRECLTKGFGAGMYSEKSKTIPGNSLQKIKYIGEIHEDKFIQNNINNIQDLKTFLNNNNRTSNKNLLKKCLTKNNGILDKRAYNSVLLYFHSQNVRGLPSCKEI